MLRLVSLKLGRLYRYVKLAVLGSLAAALVLNTHSLLASLQRNELSERRFLQLNKCPACWGTSWCRKFLNGQLRLESWGRLRLLDFFNVKNVYFARYGEPREGSRRVVLKRLGSAQELADIDTKICRRATGRGRCDLLQALPATEFASLNGDVRLLTPGAVEGWSDLVHCPSQRLLDRLVRRYAETKDSGSFLLRNLKDSERMQLLITLAFNPEPLVLQINLRTGTCGTKASLMTVIKKLVCPSLKRFFVLVSLWTTTITPFVRTFCPDMPHGEALQGGSSTTPQLRLPKTGAWKPCWMSVPTQRKDTVDSKPPRNSGNTLHN
uniref:Divergent protein kinase domain 2A n=1 Tax=Corvus moneduloides TaxID=1196302 RepID=A0A8U7P4N2_CORMO